jgi:hypothetical protein
MKQIAALLIFFAVLSGCNSNPEEAKSTLQFQKNESNSICWSGLRNSGRSVDLYLYDLAQMKSTLIQSLEIQSDDEDQKDLNLQEAFQVMLSYNLQGSCNVFIPKCNVETGTAASR